MIEIFVLIAAVLVANGAQWFVLKPAPDARAGKGARHRAPGLPRVRPSGTRPRRRADVQLAA